MNPVPLNWMIGIIAAVALSCLVAGGIMGWHEKALRVPALLDAQKTTDQTACATAQQLTKDTNDDIQKTDAYIAGRADALRLQHPTSCVHVSSRPKLPGSGAEHAGHDGNGLNTDWLRSYAATAETYRSELLACIDFLAKERTLNADQKPSN